MKRVIIIEDNTVLLDSYKYYFGFFEAYELINVYTNVDDALKNFANDRPDIIISDISLPGINGIDGMRKMKAIQPLVKVIIVSIHDDQKYILNAFKYGADGFLTKPISKEKLVQSLELVEIDGAPLSINVTKTLIDYLKIKSNTLFSEREYEIIKLLAQGEIYATISENYLFRQVP